jgi:hypothetical protein
MGMTPGNYSYLGQVTESDGTIINCGQWSITVLPSSGDTCSFGTPAVEVNDGSIDNTAPFTRGGTATGNFTWVITVPSGATAGPFAVPDLNSPGGTTTKSFAGLMPGNYSFKGQVTEANGSIVDCGTWALTVATIGIRVQSATYGGNQGAAPGNWNAYVQPYCESQLNCTFAPFLTFGADPFPNLTKDFSLSWTCFGVPKPDVYVPAEAGFSNVTLTCP